MGALGGPLAGGHGERGVVMSTSRYWWKSPTPKHTHTHDWMKTAAWSHRLFPIDCTSTGIPSGSGPTAGGQQPLRAFIQQGVVPLGLHTKQRTEQRPGVAICDSTSRKSNWRLVLSLAPRRVEYPMDNEVLINPGRVVSGGNETVPYHTLFLSSPSSVSCLPSPVSRPSSTPPPLSLGPTIQFNTSLELRIAVLCNTMQAV